MKKEHGNSNQNEAEHHLYEIRDEERKGVFKYGICGDPLNRDGSSPRANQQTRFLNAAIGWARFFANILLVGIPGRLEAKRHEDEHIEAYRKIHGQNPPGNS